MLGWPALPGVEFGNLCSLRLEPPHQEGTTQSHRHGFRRDLPPPAPPPGSPGPRLQLGGTCYVNPFFPSPILRPPGNLRVEIPEYFIGTNLQLMDNLWRG